MPTVRFSSPARNRPSRTPRHWSAGLRERLVHGWLRGARRPRLTSAAVGSPARMEAGVAAVIGKLGSEPLVLASLAWGGPGLEAAVENASDRTVPRGSGGRESWVARIAGAVLAAGAVLGAAGGFSQAERVEEVRGALGVLTPVLRGARHEPGALAGEARARRFASAAAALARAGEASVTSPFAAFHPGTGALRILASRTWTDAVVRPALVAVRDRVARELAPGVDPDAWLDRAGPMLAQRRGPREVGRRRSPRRRIRCAREELEPRAGACTFGPSRSCGAAVRGGGEWIRPHGGGVGADPICGRLPVGIGAPGGGTGGLARENGGVAGDPGRSWCRRGDLARAGAQGSGARAGPRPRARRARREGGRTRPGRRAARTRNATARVRGTPPRGRVPARRRRSGWGCGARPRRPSIVARVRDDGGRGAARPGASGANARSGDGRFLGPHDPCRPRTSRTPAHGHARRPRAPGFVRQRNRDGRPRRSRNAHRGRRHRIVRRPRASRAARDRAPRACKGRNRGGRPARRRPGPARRGDVRRGAARHRSGGSPRGRVRREHRHSGRPRPRAGGHRAVGTPSTGFGPRIATCGGGTSEGRFEATATAIRRRH